MVDGEDLLCWECVADPVLREWLREHGQAGNCSFCGQRRIACQLHVVAEKIDEVIREFYRPGEETAHAVPDSDNPQYWADGDPATEIIQEIAGVEPEVAAAIDEYLAAAEWRHVNDGGDAYYGDVPLEHIDAYPAEFMETWLRFEERLKHKVRFFDEEGKRLLDELFTDLPALADGKAILTIEPGSEFSTLYRARIIESDSDPEAFIRDPARQLGPPPAQHARAGRMNPAGIPAFYGAFSEEVAIAEVRPPVGATVAVGRFSLLRPVRLLDLPFLPFAYHEESIFSPAYDHLRNKVFFLEQFHRRISRPVLPGDEILSYLPTQAMAAYVENVMGLDGVIYESTQVGAQGSAFEQVDRKLCNIALFGDAAIVAGIGAIAAADDVGSLPPDILPGFVTPTINDAAAPLLGTTAGLGGAEVVSSQDLPPGPAPPTGEPPTGHAGGSPATLHAEPQPRLVKIRSVKVETSPMFAHLYEDGSVIIDDFERDDD
jgi:hypothetical protein